ncbi:MAG: DMT family transporter [Clostridiales bacterium]|uniref:DMT family transporter n=1 Tax=Peptostreptococcus porci TaxID=2652282 RepID=UPI002A8409CA|nr:DMT family transporter [Peptostreptococcus porci]MDD7347269.1 DMT family transporter [Clostridiales bacterium]MDY4129006.1 DMT family transporter [Peptostreptococcus porci]
MISNDNNKSIMSIVSLALVALAWGTSYAIIKDTLSHTTPFVLMTIRFGLSTLLLSIIYYRKLIRIKRVDLINGVKIGIFMFGAFITLVTGIKYTTASKQSFIVGSYVLIVPFLTWLINKNKPDKYDVIGVICAVIGLFLLTAGSVTGINIGDIISMGCALSFALHMIMIEKYCHDSDPIILTIVQFATTSILFILLVIMFEKPDFSVISTATSEILYLVIVATVIAFVVQNIAQRHISSITTSLILTLESVFGSVFAIFYLDEKVSVNMVIGCAIILIGIVMHETKDRFIKNN